MASPNTYVEEISSQLPAAQLLIGLGWQYLAPDQALALRGGRESNVVLTAVLEPWLRINNGITYKGQRQPFSDAALREAVERLVNEPFQSLQLTSERLYELLTLGTSLTQTIGGDRKSYSLHYIDWQYPERNVYHVTEEYTVERQGSHATRRPDLVLFVNGIPLVVIECKRPDLNLGGDKPVVEAISQMIRNQDAGEIPHLFVTTQLLLAISGNDALYGTTGTRKEFWAIWREEETYDAALLALVNAPLDPATQDRLYSWRPFGRQL
jgi:type I restriction enzyme, R subunit